MRVTRPRRLAFLVSGAVLWLLAVESFAPRSAVADCGSHYVLSAEQRLALLSGTLSDLHLLDADRAGAIESPATNVLRPKALDLPCSGPSCSRRSTIPDLPSPPAPWIGDDWCNTTVAIPFDAPGPKVVAPAEAKARPIRFANRIEEPPRP